MSDISSVSSARRSSVRSPPSSIGEKHLPKSMTPQNVRILAGLFVFVYVLDLLSAYDSLSLTDNTDLKRIKYTRVGIDSLGILLSLVFIVKPDNWHNKYLYWAFIGIPIALIIAFILQSNVKY